MSIKQVDARLFAYLPESRCSDAAVIIFLGGGYTALAEHAGEGYATVLNEWGIIAFVLQYRVSPNTFPANTACLYMAYGGRCRGECYQQLHVCHGFEKM